MTRKDIVGELEFYAMRIEGCTSERMIKEMLSELREAIPGWKKDFDMDEKITTMLAKQKLHANERNIETMKRKREKDVDQQTLF